ncbi:hypothetical protein [Roseobacter sinensis]|uniref:Uncharacterized protein n=1 Tax=Roseobacter sinensis TaxID=2931391 RepID=A0ABT3BBX7_9RHOB|nr:hypothetical protein [Roseobacter sp. WL0113]MCV3271091.1 hypothetical protein [Roseobacter sp. WL0113]
MALWQWISWPFRREPRRPLAYRQPQRSIDVNSAAPLGLEAMDLAQIDAVNRRNAALERVSNPFAPHQTRALSPEGAETAVTAPPDDETYAARYHRAYNPKEGETR